LYVLRYSYRALQATVLVMFHDHAPRAPIIFKIDRRLRVDFVP
jgi:hypothetical protein